jgi:hypothetical protein
VRPAAENGRDDIFVRVAAVLSVSSNPEEVAACELWNDIALSKGAAAATKSAHAKGLKRALSLIVERRNKIAHEGDLQPSFPRTPWPISRVDVSYAAGFIEDLVRTIDGIV